MASGEGEQTAPAAGAGLTIGSAAMLGLVGSLANVGLAVVRSKVTATTLGPDGFGKVAVMNQYVGLANVVTTAMTGVVLVNQLAKARVAGDDAEVRRIFAAALGSALLISALAGLASVVAGFVWLPPQWGPSVWPLMTLAALATVFSSCTAVCDRTLVVHERFDRATFCSIVTNVVQTALIASMVLLLGLGGYFTATAISAAVVLPLYFAVTARSVPTLPRLPRVRFDRGYMKQALSFGATSLVSNGYTQGLFSIVRWQLERKGGPALNGQYQAAAAVGNQYFVMVLQSLAAFAYPRYAAARTNDELVSEVKQTCAFMFRLTPPLVLAGIAFRGIVIRLFYSAQFAGAADLLGWQMAGDVAKAISWALVGPLFMRGRFRAYLVTETIGFILHAALSLVLIPRYGLVGEGYAQMATLVVMCFVALATLRASCQVDLSYRPALLVLPLTLGAIVAVLATNRWPHARWVVAAVAAIWAERVGLLAAAWSRVRDRLGPLLGRAR